MLQCPLHLPGAAAQENSLGHLYFQMFRRHGEQRKLFQHPIRKVPPRKIGGGRIDRDATGIMTGLQPSAHIAQNAVEHLFGQRHGNFGMFKTSRYAAGQLQAQTRMMPAQQRFITQYLAITQINLGLIIGCHQPIGDDAPGHADH